MICKNCGERMPDPAPVVVVTEKVVEVHHDDGYYWLRIAFLVAVVFIVLIGSTASVYWCEGWALRKAMAEPTIKIKNTTYDSGGRVIQELNR